MEKISFIPVSLCLCGECLFLCVSVSLCLCASVVQFSFMEWHNI